jgi:hypothetical protein
VKACVPRSGSGVAGAGGASVRRPAICHVGRATARAVVARVPRAVRGVTRVCPRARIGGTVARAGVVPASAAVIARRTGTRIRGAVRATVCCPTVTFVRVEAGAHIPGPAVHAHVVGIVRASIRCAVRACIVGSTGTNVVASLPCTQVVLVASARIGGDPWPLTGIVRSRLTHVRGAGALANIAAVRGGACIDSRSGANIG